MRLSVILLAAATVLVLAASAPAQTSANRCGHLNQSFETNIVAHDIGCRTGRAVVRKWHKKAVTETHGPGNLTTGGYSCVSHTTDPEHVRVRCTNQAAHDRYVTFDAGP